MGDIGLGCMSNNSTSIIVPERPIDQARPLKVIYIGAGISGILATIEFLKAVPTIELIVYEKNPEIGGTWYENRYPGCACDIPSHGYQLSFESWKGWTQFYAQAPEIQRYWQRVADKYDSRKHIRFQHKCVKAQWDESRSKWMVELQKFGSGVPLTVFDEADVLITGTGLLNEWKWPSIEGLHQFQGRLLHTANWDENFDATGKSVAVIGAGSSGIQVVPALTPLVKAMDHYVRGKTWIATQLSEDILEQSTHGNANNFEYTESQIAAWESDPLAYVNYRKSLEYRLQGNYAVSYRGSARQAVARHTYEANMRERLLAKPELLDQLIPDYPPLCKRLTPGPGYLEALTQPHVDLISQAIEKVDATGVFTTDGKHRPVDAIICATGFDTTAARGFPIQGRDGINLRDKYATRPKTYLGIGTDNFPNFFQSLGPNSFQGAGSLLIMMEQVHKYIAQILRRMAYGNVKTIEPKRRQVENFTNYCTEYFKRTVYSEDCPSWYKTPLAAPSTGQQKERWTVTALWPGSSVHAIKAMADVRWDDFEMETVDGNDFGWFGNGLIAAETETTADVEGLTWYLNDTKFLDEPRCGRDPRLEIEQVPKGMAWATTT